MKKLIVTLGCVAIAPLAFAQTSSTTETTTAAPATSTSTTETSTSKPTGSTTETTTTTTRSVGTVSTFTPGKVIVVKTTSATDPISYTLGKTVTYVTRAGKTIEHSMIKPGAKVEVMYDKSGPDMVVNRVIVDQ